MGGVFRVVVKGRLGGITRAGEAINFLSLLPPSPPPPSFFLVQPSSSLIPSPPSLPPQVGQDRSLT